MTSAEINLKGTHATRFGRDRWSTLGHPQRTHDGPAILPVGATPDVSAPGDERLLATHGRTFHFAARFLPHSLRRELVTLYAFFRTLDDLVDAPPANTRPDDVRHELAAWHEWLTNHSTGCAPREPLGSNLAHVTTVRRVPDPIVLDFLAGVSLDLDVRQIGDFAELRRYCYGVAGTVGLALAHVMGATSSHALAAAEHLGVAMQLTNIVRDIGGDLANGRVYLPEDELRAFGLSRSRLIELYVRQQGPDERFRALMRFQIARARQYYARGMAGIWLLPPDCRLPILLAARLYRRILDVIERNGYDVLRERAATGFGEKVREAVLAFALDHMWRWGESPIPTDMEIPVES